MSNEEVLTKAIEKVVANGWTGEPLFDWIPEDKQALLDWWLVKQPDCYKAIIFNHDFAKALWGERQMDTGRLVGVAELYSESKMLPAWQYHIQQMVVSPGPIQYLAEHMPS